MTARSRFKCQELLKQNTQIEVSSSTLSALFNSRLHLLIFRHHSVWHSLSQPLFQWSVKRSSIPSHNYAGSQP